MAKSEKATTKPRRGWKKWKLLLLLVLLGLLYFYMPGFGGGASTVWTSAVSLLSAIVHPPKAPDNTAKTPEQDNTEVTVKLKMRFIDRALYLENWRAEEDLPKVIQKIRQKYTQQRVIIEYEERPKDPLIKSQRVEEILKSNGFMVERKKLAIDGKAQK